MSSAVMMASATSAAAAVRAPTARASRSTPTASASRHAPILPPRGACNASSAATASSIGAATASAISIAARPATSSGLRHRRQRFSDAAAPSPSSMVPSAAAAASDGAVATEDSGENAAIINTIKAIFGAGGFALPWAFAQGGTVLVSVCLAASCVLALEALKMLVKAQETLVIGKLATQMQVGTYAGLTKQAIGPIGDVLCKVLNVVTCFGISVGYLIFISDTALSMLPKAMAVGMTTNNMIVYVTPFMLMLSWLRSFKGVNLISLLGTVSVTLGMIWVMIVALSNPLQIAAIPIANPSAFSGFFGTVAFLFFIHFTLFPIQEAMPNPKRFVPAVSKAFYLAMFVGGFFGIVGAWGFGPGVKSVVITMLDGGAGLAVKMLLCINLLFTFPIMARSCLVILEDAAKGKADEISTPLSLLIRSAFVVGAATLASVVPNFGVVLGLVGGVCCCAMTLVLPPVILLKSLQKARLPIKTAEFGKIGFVLAVGTVCMVLSVVL